MLELMLFVLAVLAGLLGFGGIFSVSSSIGWVLVVFLASTAAVVVARAVRNHPSGQP